MGIDVTIDDADLGEIQVVLSNARPETIYTRAAPAIEQLITEQFWAGTDPFGATWAPLKAGGASHLIDKGDLLSSVKITGQQDGLGFEMDQIGEYHQKGVSSRNLPARPILPLGGEYPDSWDSAISDSMVELLAGYGTKGGG